jgi:hypothetical protein
LNPWSKTWDHDKFTLNKTLIFHVGQN